jgi:hypothetical protein
VAYTSVDPKLHETMPIPLYTQTVIALIWDFDRTLIPGNQQDPLFEEYGVDPKSFWTEVDGLVDFYKAQGIRVARDTAYLTHLLTYVDQDRFAGLTRERLFELGKKIEMSPGIPDFLEASKHYVTQIPEFVHEEITVEHYVVSTGILPMIQGSSVAPFVDYIWANDFIERPAPPGYQDTLAIGESGAPISHLGYTIDNTSKTRAVFEINKGVNKTPSIDVNALMSEEQRRVPIKNMIYIADGPSDVPVFSILNERGGKTLGVYTTTPVNNFRQVRQLQSQGRIQGMAEADYREGRAAHLWLIDSIDQIAREILDARHRAFAEIPRAPGHAD